MTMPPSDSNLAEHIMIDAARMRLVGAIVAIGRSRDPQVMVEGVETDSHAEVCRQLGCDVLQGFAFADPQPKFALERYQLCCSHSR